MSYASLIGQGMQLSSSVFGMYASEEDARTQKAVGYASANANEERTRRESRQELGTLRASMAENGFTLGSQAELYGQSAGNAELDALTKRYEGELTAWKSDAAVARAKEQRAFMLDPIFHSSKGGSLLFGGGVSYFGGSKIKKG